MKRLRVIQIGTAHDHAADTVLTCKGLPEDFQLLGVVEEDESRRALAEKRIDYAEVPFLSWQAALAKRPDAFLIETEEQHLVDWATRVLELGYPVHIDKPGGEDPIAFRRMCALARQKNLVLSLGYMYRYNPAVLYAKQLVREGKLGEIISVEAQMNCSYADPDKRKWLGNFKGGMLFFLGCHLIDLVATLQGFPEEIVPLSTKTMLGGVDSLDYGFCVYRYKNGLSFVKTNATECNGFDRRQLVITGSKGSFEIKPFEVTVGEGRLTKLTRARETFGVDRQWIDNSHEVVFPPVRRYDAMLSQFAKYVRGEESNPYTYAYEARLHELILASCGL